MSRKFSEVSKEEIISAVLNCDSKSKVLIFLDVPKNGNNTDKLNKFIEENDINIDHFRRNKKKYCLNCKKEISNRNKYCSNTCLFEYEYKSYISRWKEGLEDGIIGSNDVSNYIRKYLFEIHNNSCELCGWNLINPYTHKVPLLIHHIDGNCLNNSVENLQLLCPNCHSLTENFGSRNNNCTRIDKRIR